MMRFALVFSLTALLLCSGEIFAQNSYELTFVSSVDELDIAIKKGDILRGLAVRSEFYSASNQKVKKQIDELVRGIQNGLRPVFIYGQETKLEILEAWYSKARGQFKCKPTAAGVFSTIPIANKLVEEIAKTSSGWADANFLICDSHIEIQSEKEFRDRIDGFWQETKKSLKEEGWAVLN